MKRKVEIYKRLLENIEGLVVVDRQGTIIMMDDSLARDCYVNGVQMTGESVVGMDIMEVIPTTNIMKCFEEKGPKIADYYFVEGRTIVSTRRPVYEKGEIAAAMEYDLFGIGGEFLTQFLAKTEALSNDIGKFRDRYHTLQQAKYTINEIMGHSPLIQNVKKEIQLASRHNSTVLIEGETGSGKELVAHAIHALSDRQLGRFVRVNCAAIPETLMESELFGYEEGSFTGGKKGGKKGMLEAANGGTVFLDEINQLQLSAQPKLLRALQEQEITPIGSDRNIPLDVRVIVTSNEDLQQMAAQGRFRQDLFYRLNVINIKVPSLRERKEDIPDITGNIISKMNLKLGKNVAGASQLTLKMLESYNWPGNVRELHNVIERAMHHCDGTMLKTIHFSDTFVSACAPHESWETDNAVPTLEQARNEAERKAIVDALIAWKGNKVKSAKALNISRSLIHKKIVAFNIVESEYV